MKSLVKQCGFTLVELLVTVSIMVFLLLASAPYLVDWSASAQVKDANSKLRAAYGLAKAMALRNPNGVTDGSYTAAGMLVLDDGSYKNLYVCASDPSNSSKVSDCINGTPVNGLSTRLWSTNFVSRITMTAASWPTSSASGSTYSYLGLNNVGASDPSYSTAYTLSRGAAANSTSGSYVSDSLQ